ncbi:hypothetical protein D0859_16730 [Hortaea werneckii]|uniref:Uncharacterized protein n=1 Tax=Hortaea werneckii TaxID=91943 RepID=A0A3M7I1E6_HORWE|nr:hypothetical protein D0859_16730 [Hortaea werneckii]
MRFSSALTIAASSSLAAAQLDGLTSAAGGLVSSATAGAVSSLTGAAGSEVGLTGSSTSTSGSDTASASSSMGGSNTASSTGSNTASSTGSNTASSTGTDSGSSTGSGSMSMTTSMSTGSMTGSNSNSASMTGTSSGTNGGGGIVGGFNSLTSEAGSAVSSAGSAASSAAGDAASSAAGNSGAMATAVPGLFGAAGIHIPRPALQIPLKALTNLQNLLNLLHAQHLPFLQRQRLRRPYRILDLPTIKLMPGQHIQILLREIGDLHTTTCTPRHHSRRRRPIPIRHLLLPIILHPNTPTPTPGTPRHLQKHPPNPPLRLSTQLPIPQGQMNPTLKRLIERIHAISREEQNPLKILQQPQKDTDQRIAMNIMNLALLQKHIRLIEQQHGTPRMRNIQDLLQLVF